jgi:hypothetical protein
MTRTAPHASRAAISARLILALCLLLLPLVAAAYNQNRVLTDEAGNPLRIQGSVVIVEPDIELTLVTAGGLQEPRREWSEAARRYYPASARALLAAGRVEQKADYDIPDSLDPDSRLGQIIRLNEAVAYAIAEYTRPGSRLATKGRRLDWTLGPGVSELRAATGADYALFTYIRDSYSSGGRTALRILGILAGAAMGSYLDIGGGMQLGVATLVDLRTGQVVWFNLMARQSGDLRDAEGADKTVRQMLQGLPL